MNIFKKKEHIELKNELKGTAEKRFDSMMELIKDLPKADYNRLKDAMDLGYSAYQKVRNVKTADEKENEDMLNAEKQIVKEIQNDN